MSPTSSCEVTVSSLMERAGINILVHLLDICHWCYHTTAGSVELDIEKTNFSHKWSLTQLLDSVSEDDRHEEAMLIGPLSATVKSQPLGDKKTKNPNSYQSLCRDRGTLPTLNSGSTSEKLPSRHGSPLFTCRLQGTWNWLNCVPFQE